MLKRIKFFEIDFVKASYEEVLDEFFRVLIKPFKKPQLIFTPNNEMIVESKTDADFLKVLKKVDYALPDSTGIYLASKFLTWPNLKTRITGVDITKLFLEENQKYKVFILGGQKGAAEILSRKYKQVVDFYDAEVNPQKNEEILKRILASKAEVLLVALGAPKQEKWLFDNQVALKGVKLAFGVGGTIDFLAGKQKRAPRFFRVIGMEWLWRLLTDWSRFGRIYRATIVFAWICLKERFSKEK